MHFTREPIIETVITPREGYKLIVRNSKRSEEEYTVNALEVVSFGGSIFYRSTEKPKAFLLPVSDYEVFEAKESRMVLKTTNVDRTIKINSGKETQENLEEKKEKKNQKRKGKKKKQQQQQQNISENQQKPQQRESLEQDIQKELPPPPFSRLFPPPPTLIKDKLSQSKEAQIIHANLLDEKTKEDVQKELDLPKMEESSETTIYEEKTSIDLAEPEPLEEPIFDPDSFESTSFEEDITKKS